jgi:hypothetical protein
LKGKQFERLARKYLGPLLADGYVSKGKLMYETPVGVVLRGFCVDDSSFDAANFTVWMFAQPLYVPEDHIVLTLGRRFGQLGGGPDKWWTLTPENESAIFAELRSEMQEATRLFVARCRTPDDLADFIPTVISDTNFHVVETVAFSCILAGRVEEAVIHLDRLRILMRSPTYEWERVVLRRAERISSVLAADAAEAKRLLEGWADGTARALSLTPGP